MTDTNKDKLYLYLGISEERFIIEIEPFMDALVSKGGKVDQALLAIERNRDLRTEEKLYCSYCIGRVAVTSELNMKTGGWAKRLGFGG